MCSSEENLVVVLEPCCHIVGIEYSNLYVCADEHKCVCVCADEHKCVCVCVCVCVFGEL